MIRTRRVVQHGFARLALAAGMALATVAAALLGTPRSAFAVSPNVVISQVYGGGGNSGAPFTHDFIELFNRGTTAVALNGWSVQYASATGTGNFASNPVVALSGSIAPGQYYLVQLSGGSNGAALPTPDATGSINASGTAGKFVLASTTTGITCNGGSAPCDDQQKAQIVDLVGYGSANFFEGSAAPALSNTTAALRASNGCVDTDNNATDFTATSPSPRNTATTLAPCGVLTPSLTLNVSPATFSEAAGTSAATATVSRSVSTTAALDVTLSSSDTSEASVPPSVTIAADATSATFAVSAIDDTLADGNQAVTLSASAVGYTNGTASITVTDNDATPGTLRIRDVQGASQVSPLVGQAVTNVPGIVTAVRTNGFYYQDPNPDANDATSEAIFVFTSSAPTVAVGDSVLVSGTVSEFRPGGNTTTNLTTSQISNPGRVVTILSSGNALPAPTVIGLGGRTPPTTVIEDDNDGDADRNVETAPTPLFDPEEDGLDFYESLEAMLVQVNNAVAVGPTNDFGEIFVLADNGANAGPRTARGGIVVGDDYSDFNPERIQIDDKIVSPAPEVNVGDSFTSAIVGVIDYDFGNFELLNTQPLPTVTSGGLQREVTTLVGGADQLTIATFNVENLDPGDGVAKFDALAAVIVNNLKSPDIVSLEEVQDNDGAANNGVVDADNSYQALINAVVAAGGPAYEFRQVNPVDGQDGGEPGGNIRVGFLFNPSRVTFVDRPGGSPTAANSVQNVGGAPQLAFSPGRIDPTNAAFNASRKPLAGEFIFNGQTVFVIANHFNSKGGDDALFGRFQPQNRSTEVQRQQQATVVRNFVRAILAVDPNANVAVVGDLNDFEFSPAVSILEDNGLLNTLIETLPKNERYSYVFEGNSQTLDHILVSDNLFANLTGFDSVHANAEFADQISDHDPQVARFRLNLPPTVAIVGGAGVCANGNTPTGTFQLALGDENVGALSLSASSSNTTAVPTGNVVFGGSGASRTVTITGVPSQNSVRSSVVTISVSDGFNTTSLQLKVLVGTPNDNNITGDAAISNLILGLGGQDRLTGGTQADLICGGSGDNRIAGGDGDDTIVGGSNQDRIEGEGGNDTLGGGAGDDRLLGGDGDDTLSGGDNNDKLEGGAGNDSLSGGAGDDSLSGGDGNDALAGDAGNDALAGDAGDDTLTGGAQRDRFGGGAGADSATDFTPSQGDTSDGSVEIGV